MMKTKKEMCNYALNLQELITGNHIIIYDTLLKRPNNYYVIIGLLDDLKRQCCIRVGK